MQYLWILPVVGALLVLGLVVLAFRGARRRRAHLFLLTTDSAYQASHAGELHEQQVGDFRGPEGGRREMRLLDFMHSCGDIGHKKHRRAVAKVARRHHVAPSPAAKPAARPTAKTAQPKRRPTSVR